MGFAPLATGAAPAPHLPLLPAAQPVCPHPAPASSPPHLKAPKPPAAKAGPIRGTGNLAVPAPPAIPDGTRRPKARVAPRHAAQQIPRPRGESGRLLFNFAGEEEERVSVTG